MTTRRRITLATAFVHVSLDLARHAGHADWWAWYVGHLDAIADSGG